VCESFVLWVKIKIFSGCRLMMFFLFENIVNAKVQTNKRINKPMKNNCMNSRSLQSFQSQHVYIYIFFLLFVNNYFTLIVFRVFHL
jgi:hypothetical protein